MFSGLFRRGFNFKINDFNRNFALINTETKDIKQDDVLRTFVNEQKNLKRINWENLQKQVLSSGTVINKVNFDASVIGFCLPVKRLDLAKAYVEYIKKSRKQEPNIAVLGRLLKLYYLCYQNVSLTAVIEEEIYNLCDLIQRKREVLDAFTTENIILALSLTKRWKKCLELLDNMRVTCTPNSLVFSVIVAAAFNNNEPDISWTLLKTMLDDQRLPGIEMYTGFQNYCEKQKSKALPSLERFFEIFYLNDLKPPKEFITNLISINWKMNMEGYFTKITEKGKCVQCNNYLEQLTLSKDEFELLKNTFYYNVLLDKNIYTKTTPTELQMFKRFITDKRSRFDIVVDGLNVAFSAGNKQSPIVYSKLIASVVRHFVEKEKSVLVLGRAHMRKWKNMHMSYIFKNASLFLTDDLSQDDPFLVYATMYNGSTTGFVSRDLMRNHIHKLEDPHLKTLFRRWQNQVQHQVIFVEKNGNVQMKQPLNYMLSAQKVDKYWHIPFIGDNLENQLSQNIEWACFKI